VLKLKSIKSLKTVSIPSMSGTIADIEIIGIDSIKLWDKNPRKNGKAIPKVMESIKEYGQRTPIVGWRKNRTIYKGNTTWKAMQKLGYNKIAVAWADFKDEAQAIAYGLADNKTGEFADWDDNVLAQLLQGETFAGLDMSEIGRLTAFAEKDLRGLSMSTGELPADLLDIDIDAAGLEKADFLVIQFPSKEKMAEFKAKIPSNSKHPRVVSYEDLMNVMSWKSTSVAVSNAPKFMLKRRSK